MENDAANRYIAPRMEVLEIDAEGVLASSIRELENCDWN